MIPRRRLALVIAMLGGVVPTMALASEPHAVFAVKNGWVEFSVRKAGKPMGDATIEVRDEAGKTIANGETDGDGLGAFPLPRGESFVVELKTGERTADPIRLYRSESGVEPSRVLLSYGLRPCCRSLVKREPIIAGFPEESLVESDEESWLDWRLGGAIFAVFWLASIASIMTVRRTRQPLPEPTKDEA